MLSRRALLAAALSVVPVTARAQEKWTTYYNERFGASIEYPSRFRMRPAPENNDGRGFTAPDGATLSSWGSLNVEHRSIAELEEWLREIAEPDDRITYRAAGKNWLVFSGTRDDRIFYRRYVLSHRGEIENGLVISYPAKLAKEYAPIVARISKSFRPGSGYQTTGKP